MISSKQVTYRWVAALCLFRSALSGEPIREGGRKLFYLLAIVFILGGSPLWGDDLVWDASGINPNNPTDGSGNWDANASNAVWSNVLTAPAGAAQDSAWNDAANNIAVFGNNVGGTVTIDDGNVNVGGLVFNNTSGFFPEGYTIMGGSGSDTLTLGGSAPTITTNANATIEATIAGSSGFTKEGTAQLTLDSINGYNPYTGLVTVAAGTLVLYGGPADITGDLTINSGATVQTNGFNLISSNSNVTDNGMLQIGAQNFGQESIASLTGSGTVKLSPSISPALTLNLTQSQTFAGTFTGGGSIEINAAQSNLTETWTNATPFTGNVTVNNGILSVQSLGASLGLTLDSTTFRYTGSGSTTTTTNLAIGPGGGTLDASGSGALDLTNNGIIGTTTGTNPILTLTGSSTAANTLGIPLIDPGSGTLSLVKNGVGTWILTNGDYYLTNGNSYSGGTTINQGILELESGFGYTYSLGSGPVTLNASGKLSVFGGLSANSFTAVGGTLVLNNAENVGFNSFMRASGGGLVIVPSNSTALGTTELVGAISGFTVVNGIVDGSVVAQNSPTDSSADFLNLSNGLVRATYSTATAITNGVTGGTTSTSVYHATVTSNNDVFTPSQIYALKVDSGAFVGGAPLTIGDGTHTAGVIINGNTVTAPTTIYSAITFASGSEGSIYVGGNGTANYAFIAAPVIGTNGLTKNGNGFLELYPAQYSGTTTVNEGTLQFDHTSFLYPGGAFGSVVNLASTLLYFDPVTPVQATVNLTSDATIGSTAGSEMFFLGTINGNGHALTIGNPNGTGVVQLQGTLTNVSQYDIINGTVLNTGTWGSNNVPIVMDANTATLELATNSTLANPITFMGGTVETGYNTTITGPITVLNSSGSSTVNQVAPQSGGNTTFSGAIGGSGPLSVNGTGQVTLTSTTNTYTGAINVNAGTLAVDGNLASSSGVNVTATGTSTATLAGTGVVGAITLGSGGKLMPGRDPATFEFGGSLTASSLLWNSDNTPQLQYVLSNMDNTSDLLNLGTGAFTKGTGTAFTFDFGGTGEAGQIYTLLTFGLNNTNFQSTDFSASNLPSGLGGTFSFVDNGSTESLDFTEAAPEPTTWALLLGGMGLLLFWRMGARGARYRV
jgi:fibronectin-binding autotransporter adhesin